MATKVLGWGRCSITAGTKKYDDIVEGTTSLEVNEGDEVEAKIEGGTAEGRKHNPDTYTLTANRRIGDASEVTLGYTETVETVKVEPEQTGAIGVTLTNPSQHVAVKFDSTDGLVAVYTWKTKGATGEDGNINDMAFAAKTATT